MKKGVSWRWCSRFGGGDCGGVEYCPWALAFGVVLLVLGVGREEV